ncbi:DHHW family protein [[Clostridium] scindens]|uniref:DHHW family protein n=1 Tax=Clostridium scindens (strain JCM 10418 / VPI 12708) TaxID=29347 RepID=UPI000471F370|nr:DHHW family protein [[Clostridium] scindens]
MRREKRKRIKRQSDKILGILFIACLFIIMILNLMTKDKKISEEENRTLTEKPRCTWDSVLGGTYMQQYESYISDQFAGRNLWRGFSAALERIGGSREENGVFLGKKKQLMEEIALPEEETLKKNIDSINGFAKRYEDMQARLLLIPDSAEILKSSLPAFASTQEQSAMLDDVRDRLSKTVQWIDGRAVMSEHADEKIYYKTDHHWTSLGAYYMYLASASELGIEEDRVNTSYHRYPVTAEFNGMLASTSGFCLSEKEEIEVYVPEEEVAVLVNYVDEQKKRTSLYDVSKLKTKDKYAVFLGGNSSVIDIKTTSESGKTLLLIKDSFANSFVPFLIPHYKEIVLVDPRYYAGTIDDIMSTYQITDTLFLYSGNTFFQDNNISGVLE